MKYTKSMEVTDMWEHDLLFFIQQNLRFDWLTPVMKGVSFLGNSGWFFILTALILLLIPKTRKIGALMATALLLDVLIVNGILKPVTHRIRPYEVYPDLVLLVEVAKDYSFPSGHTGAAFAAATALFLALPERKKLWGSLMLVLAAFVAWSRLYVAVHYPTDVLAGFVIGVMCGALAVKTPLSRGAEWFCEKVKRRT